MCVCMCVCVCGVCVVCTCVYVCVSDPLNKFYMFLTLTFKLFRI